MDVILSGEEHIVLKYEPKEGNELLLVHDGQYGAYLILWHSEGMVVDAKYKGYEVQWRGDFKTTAKQFMVEVEAFETDRANGIREETDPNAQVDEDEDLPVVVAPDWTI